MPDASLLQLHGISKAFGPVQALRELSFDLRAGEVHALLGENGAGKSTVIKVITGAHEPDSGRFVVGGRDWSRVTPALARQLGIACVYQQPALFPDLSVAENMAIRLEEGSVWRRVRWTERNQQASRVLEQVGASIDARTEVARLSMPEQQLVEIACAFAVRPSILILDEPTASLTRREQEILLRLIREIRAQGTGIIYISHRMEEIRALADRVTVLRDGASVGTFLASEADDAELIRRMVGRELSNGVVPPAPRGAGRVVLSAQGLACEASGVRSVSMEIRAGEILGLAGLVGAGRTELARVLFGITPATAGAVGIEGRIVRITSPSQAIQLGIAYVPEDRRRHGVILAMPIEHNISLASHGRLFPRGWLNRRSEGLLAEHYMRSLRIKASDSMAPGGTLSGGNQQKLALARWLATVPKILILDEPTQGVDVGAKAEIHRMIREFAEGGMAVLLISSDLPEVLALSHRIGVMRAGTLVALLPGNSSPESVMTAALSGEVQDVAHGPDFS